MTAPAGKKKARTKGTRESHWPRTESFGQYSPFFYANNKDRFLRQLLIRDIQAVTDRKLVVYFASTKFSDSYIVDEDTLRFHEILKDFKNEPIDIMVETSGGETDATESIISLLGSITNDIRVIVPSRAKSNGTLIALAADEIIMGASSELGPIEPSIDGIPASISSTPEFAKHSFVAHKLGEFAAEQTKQLAEKLLRSGMMKGHEDGNIQDAITKLCTRETYKSHGSVINAAEAAEIGLNIKFLDVDDPLWQKFIMLHAFYDFDTQLRGISKIFEQERTSNSVISNNGQ